MSNLTPLRRIGLAVAALFMVFSFIPGIAEAEGDPPAELELPVASQPTDAGEEAAPNPAPAESEEATSEAPEATVDGTTEPTDVTDAEVEVEERAMEDVAEPSPVTEAPSTGEGPEAEGRVTADAPPGASMTASLAPDFQVLRAGADMTFSVLITNDGDVALDNISVDAPITPVCDRANLGSLAPGANLFYDCTVLSLTVDTTNVVTVEADVSGTSEMVGATSNEAVVEVRDQRLTIAITPSNQSVLAGGTAAFEITVDDVGQDPISSIDLVSVPNAPDCDRGQIDSFPTTYTCEVTNVTESFTAIASAEVYLTNTDRYLVYSGTADVTVVSELPGKIAIEISPAAQTISDGGTATFEIEVSSPTVYVLSDVVVTDPALPDCDAELTGVIQAGDSWTYSCEVVDPPNGFTHSATVVAEAIAGSEQDAVATQGYETVTATSNAAAVTVEPDVTTTTPTTTPTTTSTPTTKGPTTVDPTPTTDPTDVQSGGVGSGGTASGTPSSSANSGVGDGTLARTGSDSLALVAFGSALLLLGASALFARRRGLRQV